MQAMHVGHPAVTLRLLVFQALGGRLVKCILGNPE